MCLFQLYCVIAASKGMELNYNRNAGFLEVQKIDEDRSAMNFLRCPFFLLKKY